MIFHAISPLLDSVPIIAKNKKLIFLTQINNAMLYAVDKTTCLLYHYIDTNYLHKEQNSDEKI